MLMTLALPAFTDSALEVQERRDQGSSEFVIAFLRGGVQLNPIHSFTATEAQIYSGLYEGLVSYHPMTMEPVPAVAERWEISEDRLVYTFHLREDARYSNGDRVRASHFRDTWFEFIDPDTDAAYNFLFDIIEGVREYRSGRVTSRDEVGIRAIDDSTLEIRLRRPGTHFLRILCHHAFVPVHPDLLPVVDWSSIDEIPGNGPYSLVSRSDEEFVADVNPYYWDRDEVAIDRMRFLFTEDDDDTVTDRFNRGEIDWVTANMDLSAVQFPETIVVNPLFATTYYFIRSDVEPFSDPRVRRALALLLPWDELRSRDIHFIPTSTLVPSIPFYPELEGITAPSEDEALGLLAEAGYRLGVRLPAITIHIPQGQEAARVAGLMEDAWESALEVSVDIEVTPYPEYFDVVGESDFTVGTISWIGDFADPLTFLQMWISDSNVNDAGFVDPRFDELIDQSMLETGEARYEILAQAEAILLDSGTVLPISHSPSINLIDLEVVDGWFPNPLDIHPLRYLSFSGRAAAPGVIRFER